MQADGNLHQPFIEHIPPLIVRQLMQDDIAKILFGNVCAGQYNTWMEKSNQQRG